jgi:hypothetical protein
VPKNPQKPGACAAAHRVKPTWPAPLALGAGSFSTAIDEGVPRKEHTIKYALDDLKPEAIPLELVNPIVALWWADGCGRGQGSDEGEAGCGHSSAGLHAAATRAKPTPAQQRVALMFQAMPDKVHSEIHDCPICAGRGTVPSRLPFRMKPCDQCGGRGVVTPIRRQQLLAKLKARVRA